MLRREISRLILLMSYTENPKRSLKGFGSDTQLENLFLVSHSEEAGSLLSTKFLAVT